MHNNNNKKKKIIIMIITNSNIIIYSALLEHAYKHTIQLGGIIIQNLTPPTVVPSMPLLKRLTLLIILVTV